MQQTQTKVTGISIPQDLYNELEEKRGSISRSRFYCELLKLGLTVRESKP